jgi:hypothetical protein
MKPSCVPVVVPVFVLDLIAKVARDNPADLLSTTGLQHGELAIELVQVPSWTR